MDEQVPQLVELELKVGVAEEDPIARGFGEPRSERSPIAAVPGVVDHANVGLALGPGVDDLGASVAGAIVDHDHLEALGQLAADLARALQEFGEVFLLVEDRKDQGEKRGRGVVAREQVTHSRYPNARSLAATMSLSSSL